MRSSASVPPPTCTSGLAAPATRPCCAIRARCAAAKEVLPTRRAQGSWWRPCPVRSFAYGPGKERGGSRSGHSRCRSHENAERAEVPEKGNCSEAGGQGRRQRQRRRRSCCRGITDRELLLCNTAGFQHFISVEIFDFCLVPQHFIVSGFQQLLPPVAQLGSDRLLHPRIGQFPLPRGFFRN